MRLNPHFTFEKSMPLYVYYCLIGLMAMMAVITFFYLQGYVAPYGRHLNTLPRYSLANRTGWILMECPAVIAFAWFYWQGAQASQTVPLILFTLWQFHYVYRSFVFPFRLQSQGKRMPLLIIAAGFAFNCFNAFLNATWLSHFGHYAADGWQQWHFIIGALIFFTGFYIHYVSDLILIRLRQPGESDYKIPQGFLYRYVCSPNYLGEVITWIGFAIASTSPAAIAFAAFTIANLAPRALSHRQWYWRQFANFPRERKALLPFIL